MNRRTHIVRTGIGAILMMCALGLAAAVIAAALSGCGDRPSAREWAEKRPPFTATAISVGRSMLPTFGVFEQVRLELCRYSDLGAGDTVIYWHDGTRQYIHHRLQYRGPEGRWITAGDNNPAHDTGLFTADEFVGRTHKLN